MKLYGKNPVIERIKTSPRSIRKLVLQKGIDLSELVREAKNANLKFDSVDKAYFKNRFGAFHSQGVVADVDEFQYEPFSEITGECLAKRTVPIFLDGLTDPQNLGSIVRSLACLGGFSVVLREHESVSINETVLRVANGGENYLKIGRVTNIATTVKKLKDKGVCIVGGAVKGGENICTVDFTFPMALVIGSEGKGIRPGIERHIDKRISIPMKVAELSYNVAVATALIAYEVNRHRDNL